MTALATSPLEPGQRIDGRYEIVSALGSGAIGRVFHVLDHELEQQSFALKIIHEHLRSDSGLMQRFSGEAVLSRQLTHQNIVRVYEFVASARYAYLVMEFVDGCSIEQLLSGIVAREISVEECFYLFEQVLNGLSAAHQIDVVHRDLKPANILVDRNGIVKLSDFGVAATLQSPMGLTKTGELIGTPSFMAPEQFRPGRCDARVDLYAFALVAFEMLTGKPAFTGNTPFEVMHAQQRTSYPREILEQRNIPGWCIDALTVCASKDPSQRTYSAGQLAAYFRDKQNATCSDPPQQKIGSRVRARRSWQGLIPAKAAKVLRVAWIGTTLAAFALVVYDGNARQRFGADFIRIHHEFGIGINPILRLLKLGEFDGFGIEEFRRLNNLGEIRFARILLECGLDKRTSSAELQSALVELRRRDFRAFTQLLESFPESVFDPEFVQSTFVESILRDSGMVASVMTARGADPLIPDANGNSVLHLAAASNIVRSVRRAISATRPEQTMRLATSRNREGNTALHVAVTARSSETLEEMLLQGISADIRDREGRTPLMLVLSLRRSTVSESMFWLLVDSSTDLDACDNRARCVRHYAETSQNAEWVSVLEEAQLRAASRGSR